MDSRPGDETLLLAVAGRDMGAFRTLYERHAGWLAIRLARRCNDRDLVADAVQDTFVAVWQRPRGFRGDGDVAAWLRGIAIRRLVSRLRTHGSIAAVSGLALAGNVLPGFAAACVARTRTAEPGLVAGAAVVLVLMMPASYRRSRWIRTFPAPGTGRPSSDPAWWIVLAVCVVATAISAGGRGLPRWRASAAIPASGAPCGYAGLGLASRVTCQAPHSARRQDDQPSQL